MFGKYIYIFSIIHAVLMDSYLAPLRCRRFLVVTHACVSFDNISTISSHLSCVGCPISPQFFVITF